MLKKHKNIILLGIVLVFLIGLSIILLLLRKPTNNQSHATAATTLSFTSANTGAIGQPLPITLNINPGTNLVDEVDIDIKYDPTIFAPVNPVTSTFATNTNTFPELLQAPTLVAPGEIKMSVGNGPNAINAISTPTTIGVFTLVPIAAGTSSITWGAPTWVFSLGANDNFNENVLAVANPTSITVNPSVTNTPVPPTPTNTPIPPTNTPVPPTNTPVPPTPTRTPTPTSTPVPPTNTPVPPTPTRTPTPTSTPVPPTATPTPTNNRFGVTLFLHDIGMAGDVVAQGVQGNMSPVRTTYPLTIELDDINNNPITTATGVVTWNPAAGNFTNPAFNFGSLITTGNFYNAKVIVPGFLHKSVSQGPFAITSGGTNTFQTIYLTNGDINNDNVVDLLDYNILLSCYSDFLPAQPSCTTQQNSESDLNDDGAVNGIDYNAWVRESSRVFGQ